MAKLDDLLSKADDSQPVVENKQVSDITELKPSGALSEAESKQAEHIRAVTEEAREKVPTGYTFSVEKGKHKAVVGPEKGLTYNFICNCSCGWQGVFLTAELAETKAKQHVFSK